jgi:hypothetical protein
MKCLPNCLDQELIGSVREDIARETLLFEGFAHRIAIAASLCPHPVTSVGHMPMITLFDMSQSEDIQGDDRPTIMKCARGFVTDLCPPHFVNKVE